MNRTTLCSVVLVKQMRRIGCRLAKFICFLPKIPLHFPLGFAANGLSFERRVLNNVFFLNYKNNVYFKLLSNLVPLGLVSDTSAKVIILKSGFK